MTLVRLVKDTWQPISGIQELNGIVVDVAKVEKLLVEGVWSSEELEKLGVKLAKEDAIPDGMRVKGEPTYITRDGEVITQREYEEIPVVEPTLEEKLARTGLTKEDFKLLVEEVTKATEVKI